VFIETTVPIIKQLEDAVTPISGWSPVDQLYTLFNLVYMSSSLEGDVVEIGAWCGRSAVAFGMAAQLTGNSRVHCIDLFPARDDWRENPDGSFSFQVTIDGRAYGGYQDQTVWREPYLKDIAPLYEKHESIYQLFIENIREAGLGAIISPFRGDSTAFVANVASNFKCRVAFLDGDHSYGAVCADIENIDTYLVPGGWICFDDAFSSYDGVNQAIRDRIIESGKFELCQQMTRKFFIARKK
jgi:predicted O-methyltransferase YrrM